MQPNKRISTERVQWHVDRTDAQHLPELAPVRLGGYANAGAFHVQDYLTPDEARELAAGLVAAADAVEAAALEAVAS